MIANHQNLRFIEDIINGMFDWVRVLDREDNIIFMNKAMSEGLGSFEPQVKCYTLIGRNTPCENCTSRRAVFEGVPQEKEEIIKGRIFSVMSSPVRDENGDIIAVVEVLRDITQVKQLQNRTVEQNRKLQGDLAIARKLQCSLLPKAFPEDKLEFSFIYKPCEALGGDFVDIFRIDTDHVGVYIADVSGHGVPASMLTVFLRSSINKKTLSPAQALEELYREFNKNDFDHSLYITVFYAIINVKDYSLTYSNAGHNVVPVIYNSERLELLRKPGIPVSDWMEKAEYQDNYLPLFSGDKIFLYTDGIVEIHNEQGEQFGEERLLNILLSDASEPSGVLNHIIDSACSFAGIDSTQVPDDITMALIKIK